MATMRVRALAVGTSTWALGNQVTPGATQDLVVYRVPPGNRAIVREVNIIFSAGYTAGDYVELHVRQLSGAPRILIARHTYTADRMAFQRLGQLVLEPDSELSLIMMKGGPGTSHWYISGAQMPILP